MRLRSRRALWVLVTLSIWALLLAPGVNGLVYAANLAPDSAWISEGGPGITIVNPGADPGWVEVLQWAELTFEAHGLVVPPVAVVLGGTPSTCGGSQAFFEAEPNPQITICVDHDANEEMTARNQKLVLHELAHAWLEANVTQRTEQAFLQMRHLESWNAHGETWSLRGCEQAANIIARTLVYGEHARAGQTAAFPLLTGVPAPYGVAGP